MKRSEDKESFYRFFFSSWTGVSLQYGPPTSNYIFLAVDKSNKRCVSLIYLLSEGDVFGQGDGGVIILFIVVHPDFSGASRVPRKNVARAAGERVGMLLTEHVADTTARNDFQGAAALPHAKRYLEVLAAPNVHVHVVLADAFEISLVDHEKAACDHRRFDGERRIVFANGSFIGAQVLPLKDQIPVEAAAKVSGSPDIGEVVHRNDVDDGTNDASRIFGHALQQRLQPVLIALAVRVEKREDVRGCGFGALHTRSHQTLALRVANRAHFANLGQFLSVGSFKEIVEEKS